MVCARQCREESSQDPTANAGDNSPRDPWRFAVDRSLQSRGEVVVHLAPHLSPGCAEITPPSRCGFSCGARRRQRSPLALRPCVPHGLRALTPPALRLSLALARWPSKNAVDVNRDEAYFRNISLVPHGTPSTSSDVERFRTTLESIVRTASQFRLFDPDRAGCLRRAITAPNTPSALDAKLDAFGAALSAAHASPQRTPRIANRR